MFVEAIERSAFARLLRRDEGAKIPLTSILCSELRFRVRGVSSNSALQGVRKGRRAQIGGSTATERHGYKEKRVRCTRLGGMPTLLKLRRPRGLENMRFCETNRIGKLANRSVTCSKAIGCVNGCENFNPVRLESRIHFGRGLGVRCRKTDPLECMASCCLPGAWESEEMAL